MGACASKSKIVEGKAPQVHDAHAQQTPMVAPDTTLVSFDQVAADQTPEKVMVEEVAKEEPPTVPALEGPINGVATKEKAEAMTPSEPTTEDKKEEASEEKIVVEEEMPSANPIIEEEIPTTAIVDQLAEEKPSDATAVVEAVQENTTEVTIKNVEAEKGMQQS